MGGSEPCRLDVVFVPEFEKPVDAYGCAEDTTGYIGRIGRAAVFCVEPDR